MLSSSSSPSSALRLPNGNNDDDDDDDDAAVARLAPVPPVSVSVSALRDAVALDAGEDDSNAADAAGASERPLGATALAGE